MNVTETDKYLSKELEETQELEGGLFAYISIRYCWEGYVATKTLYTVKNNIVYSIKKNGDLTPTGENLFNIKNECHKIGEYNPDKNNQSSSAKFSYSELKKALKL